ncbi:MAG: VWA domain-containing protein [Bacteroidales bacterium]|nr:VWA domain-containing protein [Bacteroidales bacterium]
MTFANPGFLYLLIIIPLMVGWYIWRRHRNKAEIQVSTTEVFENTRKSARQYLYHLLFAFRIIALALLVIAFARPQSSLSRKNISIKGIDVVIASDISSSMLAQDFKPNRLEASKDVAIEFIKNRPNDRIGLVVFSGESFTQCPLTTDHSVVVNLLNDIESGMIEDGTAIGDGLATSVDRLRNSKAVSKVIILLTDGVNNAGSVDPQSAAEIAELYGVRIYTIGVGSKGTAPYPVKTPFGIRHQQMDVNIDEEMLQKVAQISGGKYFRATDKEKLQDIYSEIDRMEKSKIDVTEYKKKNEEFLIYALFAAGLLLLEFILRNTVFRSVP